jgi:hypothetical protein
MIEIGHKPKHGPLVEITGIRWNRAISIDEATDLVERLEDGWTDPDCEGCKDLEEEKTELEEKISELRADCRTRICQVIKIARKMLKAQEEGAPAKPPTSELEALFR